MCSDARLIPRQLQGGRESSWYSQDRFVDVRHGAESLSVWYLDIDPRARVITYLHPDTEEAMVIVEGTLESVLGYEVVTQGARTLS